MKWIGSLALFAIGSMALAADKFDFEVANVQVLTDRAVQKEMGISEKQRNTLNDYAAVMTKATNEKIAEYQKAKKQPDDAFQKFGMSQFVEFRKKCLGVLSAPQLKRLREITIQGAGVRALLDKTVAARCGIVDPTYTNFVKAVQEGDRKVAKIKGEVGQIIQKKYGANKPKDQKEADALQTKINKDLTAEMKKRDPEMRKVIQENSATLNKYVKKEHFEKLKALMGKPFNPPQPAAPKVKKK
jgi:thymidylate synthase